MGLLARSLGLQAMSVEDPSQPLLPYSTLLEAFGLGRSDAGLVVDETQAMRLTTVYACIKIISEDLASLPLGVVQTLPDGSARIAREHRIDPLLRTQPNPYMGAMTFRGAWVANALASGNGYAAIIRDRASRVARLVPLSTQKTRPTWVEGKLVYATTATPTGELLAIQPENVLHIQALSLDGIDGISPIRNCMQAMGLALAAEKFGAQFFGNGARSTGVFSHPGILDEEAYGRLKTSISEWTTGQAALRPIVLEEGLKWDQLTIAPDEAQFLETRKFQRSEIAAIYRVPLHLLQDLERSTNNNIEHQSIDYVKHTLRPWAVRIEQEINRKLLSGGSSFYSEHDMNDLLRGDFVSQTEGFNTLRNCGVYSANDIRRRLRENPIPAEDGGDIYLAPLNMVSLASLSAAEAPAAAAAPPTGQTATGEPDGADQQNAGRMRISSAYRRLFRDAIGRALSREGEARVAFVAKAFQPVCASLAETVKAAYAQTNNTALKDDEHATVADCARTLALWATGWTNENASHWATEITLAAHDSLRSRLGV